MIVSSSRCGPWNLDVQSRHVVKRIESEPFRLFCPELTNPLKRREAAKALETLRKVVRIEEGGDMRAKARVGRVEEPSDRGVLDRAIHPFDLTVGPRMVEFREAMVDAVLGAGEVKVMRTKPLTGGEHRLNLADTPASTRRREFKAVVGEHGVDPVREVFQQPAQKVRRDSPGRPIVELREGK